MRTKPARHSTRKATGASIMALLFAALFTLTACTTTSPPPPAAGSSSNAFEKGVPGGVMVNTVDIRAKVRAIDSANRKVTLLGSDGEKFTVRVGPGAINFEQVRVGDLVNAIVTEELVVYLDEACASAPDGSAAMVALAPKGSQPGGLVAGTTQVAGKVTAIDPTSRTAT